MAGCCYTKLMFASCLVSDSQSSDQPLDFSVKVKPAASPAASSAAAGTSDLGDDGVLDLSSKPNSTKSVDAPPPPPLRPMGIATNAANVMPSSQLRIRAPPLVRAPVATSAGARDAKSVDATQCVVIADDSSSEDDDDDIAREVFSVFNLRPPHNLVFSQSTSGSPLNVSEPPLVLNTPFYNLSQPQLQAAQEQPQPPSYRPFAIYQPVSVQQPRFPAASHAAPVRRLAPPPNVVVGGPGMKFTTIPPQLSRLFTCPVCKYKNSSYEVMRAHIFSHGESQIAWTCQYCPVARKMVKSVAEQHIMTCHPEAPVVAVPFGLHPNE